jgi:hypothetical protein
MIHYLFTCVLTSRLSVFNLEIVEVLSADPHAQALLRMQMLAMAQRWLVVLLGDALRKWLWGGGWRLLLLLVPETRNENQRTQFFARLANAISEK